MDSFRKVGGESGGRARVCHQAPDIGGADMRLEAPLNTLTFRGHGQSQFDLNRLSTRFYCILSPCGCYSQVRGCVALSLLPVSLPILSVSSPPPLHHVPSIGASKPGQCWPL